MNHLNEINDNINELIMSKSFDRLTDEEKVQALAYVGSEEEYNSLRQTLMAITSSFSEENEEEFAGDELKSDLMSHFEKKYGTSGSRTKVVPLYRNTYFQLAVAASVALLVFFSIPMFRPTAEQNNQQLAMTGKTSEKNEKAAPGFDESTVSNAEKMALNNLEKADDGIAVPAEKTKENALEDAGPLKQDMDYNAGLKPEFAAPLPSGNTKDRNDAGPFVSTTETKNTANEELAANTGNSSKRQQDSKLMEQSDESKMDMIVSEEMSRHAERSKKNAAKVGKKEKASDGNSKTYSPHKHEFDGGTADVPLNNAASTASTSPARNNNISLVNFIEENKTEMIDLLFTVY